MRIRETGVWVDRWRDEGRQWPHEAPGAVVLLRNMVCVHLKSCRLAFGIVCCVCYVQTLCEKSPSPAERSPIFWAIACQHSFLNPLLPSHNKRANWSCRLQWQLEVLSGGYLEIICIQHECWHAYYLSWSRCVNRVSEPSTFLAPQVRSHYHVFQAMQESHGSEPLGFDIFNSRPPSLYHANPLLVEGNLNKLRKSSLSLCPVIFWHEHTLGGIIHRSIPLRLARINSKECRDGAKT